MSTFVDQTTRILVQGITGKEGSFWTRHMIEMGSNVVAGVTPGKEGQEVAGVPVYHSVARAQSNHRFDAAMIFVPPRFVLDAVLEAIDAGARKVVTVAEGIPLQEQMRIRSAAEAAGAMVIGGNTSGVISPGKAMLGMFPYWIERVYRSGSIGIMTRSGSLTNEVTAMIVREGFGVSTLVGIGGDLVPGTRFAECLRLFELDMETDAVVIIGELGGTMEEEAAQAVADGRFTKPLIAYIGGHTAPEGRRMGHAGAIVTGGTGSAKEKVAVLESVGAGVADRPSKVGRLLSGVLGNPENGT